MATSVKPPENHFAFEVAVKSNDSDADLNTVNEGLIVFAPMQYADLVFDLKRGDNIQMRGGTLIIKVGLSLYKINDRTVHFVATEIKKQ